MPELIPDDEIGAVYQAVDKVLYVRDEKGWWAFGHADVLSFNLPSVSEGHPMVKVFDSKGERIN